MPSCAIVPARARAAGGHAADATAALVIFDRLYCRVQTL